MIKNYHIYDAQNNFISEFDELIECDDFHNIDGVYLYAFIGMPLDKIKHFDSNNQYYLTTQLYSGRLDFYFNIVEINVINRVAYFKITRNNGMYQFGALTIINAYANTKDRVFTEIQQQSKMVYLSASYLISGFKTQLVKNEVVLDGSYIIDLYSFYCELGYGFFGTFGYMGWNLAAVRDMLNTLYQAENRVKIFWANLEQSKIMVCNNKSNLTNYPDYDFIEQAIKILKEYCDLNVE